MKQAEEKYCCYPLDVSQIFFFSADYLAIVGWRNLNWAVRPFLDLINDTVLFGDISSFLQKWTPPKKSKKEKTKDAQKGKEKEKKKDEEVKEGKGKKNDKGVDKNEKKNKSGEHDGNSKPKDKGARDGGSAARKVSLQHQQMYALTCYCSVPYLFSSFCMKERAIN